VCVSEHYTETMTSVKDLRGTNHIYVDYFQTLARIEERSWF